ncbi:TPA: hypothetical protein NGR93_004449 [Vibrio parahaemolyticus]|nr:hypothetical protein [Vibrio parahaemolyticus]
MKINQRYDLGSFMFWLQSGNGFVSLWYEDSKLHHLLKWEERYIKAVGLKEALHRGAMDSKHLDADERQVIFRIQWFIDSQILGVNYNEAYEVDNFKIWVKQHGSNVAIWLNEPPTFGSTNKEGLLLVASVKRIREIGVGAVIDKLDTSKLSPNELQKLAKVRSFLINKASR